MMNNKNLFAAAVFVGCIAFAFPVIARNICVVVTVDGTTDAASFRKAVDTELLGHPKFRATDTGCEGTLKVDFLVVEKKQYLTVRMDDDIPYRYTLSQGDDVMDKISEGVSTVLKNDPESLMQNVKEYSDSKRGLKSLVVSAENIWSLEVYESLVRTGKGASDFIPGVAFSAGRNAGHWNAFIRLHLSGFPKDVSSKRTILQVDAGISLGVSYEFLEQRNTSPYIGVGLQLKYFRMATAREDIGEDTLNEVMPLILGRLGIRFFRFYAMHCDVFVSGELPILPASDEETYLFTAKRYTPFANFGMAVGF